MLFGAGSALTALAFPGALSRRTLRKTDFGVTKITLPGCGRVLSLL